MHAALHVSLSVLLVVVFLRHVWVPLTVTYGEGDKQHCNHSEVSNQAAPLTVIIRLQRVRHCVPGLLHHDHYVTPALT